MMTSNLISRLLPSNSQARSIYDSLRAHDEVSESEIDVEERAAMAIDEENLRFHDDELGNLADVIGGESVTESTKYLPDQQQPTHRPEYDRKGKGKARANHFAESPRLLAEDPDDDVPASLLIEGDNRHPDREGPAIRARQPALPKKAHAIPRPSAQQIKDERERAHWEMTQDQQKLHQDDAARTTAVSHTPQAIPRNTGIYLSGSPKDKAMYRWVNVTNLDNFIRDLYDYFEGAGIWCIVLAKAIDILTLLFVTIFTTFLTQCVDYKKIYRGNARSLSQALVPQCTKKISGISNVAIWLVCLFVLYKIYQLLTDLPRLMRMRDFFTYLLEIQDSNMQTVSFQDVIGRVMALRDANPMTVERISPNNRKFVMGTQSKQRLDAHDIANRLMRKENYLIALVNKEILDLTLPLPFLQGRQLFSKTLQWNLEWCILDFVFNDYGQVRQLILKDSHRRELSDGLRNRFLFAGLMNVICAPVIVIYVVIVYFFKYFNQYHKNPAALGSRGYTPLAEWKFREFNELHHLFNRRLNMSDPFASRYLNQFPNIKTAHMARFITFVAGAVVSVLIVATVWDSEVLAGFDITSERPVLFYLGVFGSIWAITNGMIPKENEVFDPEYALRSVIEYTHYMPSHWQDRLHSDEVKQEFSTLYQLKLVIFFEEVLSIIITPFLLWFSLPKCAEQIIDFFREFTVHVDGVGYVCSFAVFDFKKGVGSAPSRGIVKTDVREDYYSTKHGKMAASYYNFLDNYMLNPKTGVPGHNPPGMRQQFHPPPAFPGLMSPSSGADLQSSRMGQSEVRPMNRAPRTTRFPSNTTAMGSPMASILLDPRHQPSPSEVDARSSRRTSRSRYPARRENNIREEPMEDEDELGRPVLQPGRSYAVDDTVANLGESTWEVSPANDDNGGEDDEDDGDGTAGDGVLGLVYQFQKAQTNGRPGVSIW
ncbi:putative autophagy-related protein 9 protein [Botrytis fragariae]|uniref:Autophagy-related protein 9 n=1 Tax=Botrytis fragariae TaxID=1964551 RepID=A0A8H6ANJ3_9HELO|nr:putative autophagy-related protein 9 protein [Botrytis fragariae]KAF5870684.1 putative autophagy-related protein 9 protein [Botrytis fragariae]